MYTRSVFWGALLALWVALSNAISVASTILVLSQDEATSVSGTSGLQGYGIPHEVRTVPEDGAELPELASSDGEGNYGGLIVMNEVGYEYEGGWSSALTEEQWDAIHGYQISFGVRLVHLNVFPSEEYGVTTANSGGLGCCEDDVDQTISLTDSTDFPSAQLKIGADLGTTGLWHYPAKITNDTIAKPFAEFSPGGIFEESSVAAVINQIDGREQMVFFIAWATEWSLVSNYLQHAYIHWMTRGIFLGHRKTYLNTQVDDIHLDTPMFWPENEVFRTDVADIEAHKDWQTDLNARLPPGSKYFMELCHNGNGNIITATDTYLGWDTCDPKEAVDYETPPDPPLEFMKPPGTGVDVWPAEFSSYPWTMQCAEIDALASWFMDPENRDAFAHVSHTFSHLELNNATYHDASREIVFNRDWLVQVGIADAEMFSPSGLVSPAITGLHNADAIRAWIDNGVEYVVGDNTRSLLRNEENEFWPKISNEENNGWPGLVIVPRWATNIYYNCNLPECTVKEWMDTSGLEDVTFEDLMKNEKATNVRYLLRLHPDPYMFHQANMRTSGVDTVQVGEQAEKFSLLQTWVEAVTQELMRLTNWPVRSLKHDDIAHLFLDRMTLDKCEPKLSYTLSDDAASITSVIVTANNNTCDVPIPVTFPQATDVQTEGQGIELEQLGSEPLVVWTRLSGEAVTLTLDEPITL